MSSRISWPTVWPSCALATLVTLAPHTITASARIDESARERVTGNELLDFGSMASSSARSSARLAQSAATLTAPDAAESEVIEQVGHGLMSLRQGLYRTVTVACMLPTAWETLSSRATASVAARFRVVGPLKSLPDGAIARAIVERRLTAAYRSKDFVPPHPTWPVAPEAFASAAVGVV